MQMTLPVPSEESWDNYNTSYFLNAHGGISTSKWIEAYNTGVAKVRLDAFNKYISLSNRKLNSVLEIGPGRGYFLKELKKTNPSLTYYVVESDKSVHEELRAKGAVIIDPAKLKDIHLVDALVATHVLEHTLHPIEFLQSFMRALKPGGSVFVETPCRDHEYKKIHEPHVLFFDKPTLGRCLQSCALKNIKLTYNGDSIPNLRRNAFIRKCLVKLEIKSGIPLHIFLGQYWHKDELDRSTYHEKLAIAETAPHVEQLSPARGVRGFGVK